MMERVLEFLAVKKAQLLAAKSALGEAERVIVAQEKTIEELRCYSREMLALCDRQAKRIDELETAIDQYVDTALRRF